MEMNNLRVESHVAQKNRRHKLRFQHNYGDLSHQQPPQDTHRPFSYNSNVFPSEMINSVSRNPHLLLPPTNGFLSHDQDSCPSSVSGSGSGSGSGLGSNGATFANLSYPQDCNNWNVVSYSNTSYQQDVQNFSSLPFYHNTLQQDQITLAQHPQRKNDPGTNQSIPCWMNSSDGYREQSTTMVVNESNFNNNITQGLSLSLSSVPKLKDDEPILHSSQKPIKSDLFINSDPKSLMGVSASALRNIGPLGPFTGYATILKNSKYIKSAQEVLNENCDVGYQELVQSSNEFYSHKILEEEMIWASDCSENISGTESLRPEIHRKKAKLLYMQEEICRRYKQYLQQMQMVISSFDTVAGLSAATPYVCLALKAVSRHFHYIKNVISEQLSQMKKMVGEGLCSSTTTSSQAFDGNATSASRLKSINQRIGKSSVGGASGFFASQQPVWRPQRGLPERAISVLKTWLFDHFLHPYPSDADKHMLATQTGLTRNQVSNWFINARVRIWKPMVEEIHTLETKGLAEPNSTNPQSDSQDLSQMNMSSLSNTQRPECSMNTGVALTVSEPNDQLRVHEKQASSPEYSFPLSNMDRLMSFMPYPRATFDATGLGPVSLTLGLRQNAEHGQQLQQHFGGQLIHDFVG